MQVIHMPSLNSCKERIKETDSFVVLSQYSQTLKRKRGKLPMTDKKQPLAIVRSREEQRFYEIENH